MKHNFKRYNLEFLPTTIKRDLEYLDMCCFEDYENLDESKVFEILYFCREDFIDYLLTLKHVECIKRLAVSMSRYTGCFDWVMQAILFVKNFEKYVL